MSVRKRDKKFIVRVYDEALGEWVLRSRLEKAEEALKLLANRENWHGNPEAHDAILLGHLTPFEVAREALSHPEEPS